MTNQDICCAAFRLTGETAPIDQTDYLSRSPDLLAMIYERCAPLDLAYRKTHELEEETFPGGLSVVLSDPFPLSDVFVPVVGAALAALLTLDENPELSETLKTFSKEAIEEICGQIPAQSEPIRNRYPEL